MFKIFGCILLVLASQLLAAQEFETINFKSIEIVSVSEVYEKVLKQYHKTIIKKLHSKKDRDEFEEKKYKEAMEIVNVYDNCELILNGFACLKTKLQENLNKDDFLIAMENIKSKYDKTKTVGNIAGCLFCPKYAVVFKREDQEFLLLVDIREGGDDMLICSKVKLYLKCENEYKDVDSISIHKEIKSDFLVLSEQLKKIFVVKE